MHRFSLLRLKRCIVHSALVSALILGLAPLSSIFSVGTASVADMSAGLRLLVVPTDNSLMHHGPVCIFRCVYFFRSFVDVGVSLSRLASECSIASLVSSARALHRSRRPSFLLGMLELEIWVQVCVFLAVSPSQGCCSFPSCSRLLRVAWTAVQRPIRCDMFRSLYLGFVAQHDLLCQARLRSPALALPQLDLGTLRLLLDDFADISTYDVGSGYDNPG